MEILSYINSKFGKITFEEFYNLLNDVINNFNQKEIEKISDEKIVVIGDLHGDFDSLMEILEKELNNKKIIFLGDYGDRGYYQVETYFAILTLKKELKDKIILLRGNHEYLSFAPVYPHDLPRQLLAKFSYNAEKVYLKIKEFWEKLSYCAFSEKYFFVHGGIPINLNFEDLSNETKIQLLWNDPIEEKGYKESYRGIGYLFGYDITEKFLKKYNFEKIIRAHEPCNGIKENHFEKVLTVFSMRNYYGNKNIGYLKINKKIEKVIL